MQSGLQGCYFPLGENRRHSRGLGWGAPVSGRRFPVFRSVRGGFRAPVSAGGFPISVSAVQRRFETGVGGSSSFTGLLDEWLMPWKPGQTVHIVDPFKPLERLGLD